MNKTVGFLAASIVGGILFGALNAYIRMRGGAGVPPVAITTGAIGFAAVVVSILQVFVGNKSVAQASTEEDSRAKEFRTPPGELSALYIFRDATYARFAGLELTLDDVSVGQTRGRTFFKLEVAPGDHRLSSSFPGDSTRIDLSVTVGKGQNYFIHQKVWMGMKGLCHALALAPQDAEARIRRCRMLSLKTSIER